MRRIIANTSSAVERVVIPEGIDVIIIGAGIYPAYEQYWNAILNDPKVALPFLGRAATPAEIAYAERANRTRHVVLSTKLREVAWPIARIVRDLDAVRALKSEAGGDMLAIGGAGLVSTLVAAGLVDERRAL